MREKYESLSLATLKELAKARGLKGISAMRKPELIERMLQEDEKETVGGTAENKKNDVEAEQKTDNDGQQTAARRDSPDIRAGRTDRTAMCRKIAAAMIITADGITGRRTAAETAARRMDAELTATVRRMRL